MFGSPQTIWLNGLYSLRRNLEQLLSDLLSHQLLLRRFRVLAVNLCAMFFVGIALFPGSAFSDTTDERTWKSADGSQAVEAVLIRQGNGNVQLKKSNGKTVTVPIRKLCSADQAYLRTLEVATGGVDSDGSLRPTTAEDVEQEASRARTAKEALLVYQFHLANDGLSDVEKARTEANRYQWKRLAEKGYERVGSEWMSGEDAKAQRDAAKDKLEFGYKMLRSGNGALSEKALREASELDPDSIDADFLMGIVYATIVRDYNKAIANFKECVSRQPNNVGIWNNLALCYYRRGDYSNAARSWLKAVELSPTTPALGQNVGSFVQMTSRSSKKRIRDRELSDELHTAYEKLITKHGHEPPERYGFVYMPPAGLKIGDEDGASELVVVGSGSGFVIAPGIIATNFHVIKGADKLLVLDPSDTDKHLGAELIAQNEEIDLALIRCKELTAPSLTLCTRLPPRGSDIMVLGYPLGPSFGANLKATRGAMVAMPDEANHGMCLYDALTNPGNSGGPVVDQAGRVVAVVRAITGDLGGTYGAAIPMEAAFEFFQSHLSDLGSVADEPKVVGWPEVDSRVAPSTVLILQKRETVSLTSSKKR